MKDQPYFKHDHDSRNDHKLLRVRQKFGAKGYGIYFMIIEMLRATKNYTLKYDLKTITFDIKEDEKIIDDIVKNFDLFTIKRGILFSPSLKSRMKNLDNIREGWRKGGKKRWEKKDKVDESIYKEFKG